jgi:anion-transporting  ArsA/GET3 family ATPase
MPAMISEEVDSAPYAALGHITLVTGKGGVGKTTVAAGLAAGAALRDGKAVFVEFGDGESGKRALEGARGVIHRVVEPHDAMERAVTGLLGSKLLAKVFLGNFAVKPMLRAAPALRELAMLECVRLFADEAGDKRMVVDLPATGHGLAWMRLPTLMRDLFASGPLHDLSDRVTRRLLSPESSSIVVVSLPERLVLLETLELCESLSTGLGLRIAALIVNRVPSLPPDDELARVEALAKTDKAANKLFAFLDARRRARREAIDTLAAFDASRTHPLLLEDSTTDPTAATLGQIFRDRGLV